MVAGAVENPRCTVTKWVMAMTSTSQGLTRYRAVKVIVTSESRCKETEVMRKKCKRNNW